MSVVTALACPEPPPEWIAQWVRQEHATYCAPWCTGPCEGECAARFRVGPLVGTVTLKRGAPGPSVTLSDGRGEVEIPDGVMRETAQHLLQLLAGVPAPWLRKQP